MRKTFKSILSIILVLSMLLCATVPAFAAGAAETYICELRLIYAEDYEEAKEILEDSGFSDYKLYKNNLNQGSGEIGVFLAYKTTTDIEDAITDIAVMQMNGGYQEGNYQEMLSESYEAYVAMGKVYLEAIKYFNEAYDDGDFLAKLAHRQLNFYNVVSEGIPEDDIPDFEGEHLGDIFYNGISANELATMFMEGNSYALTNIRSLIAMGVSYNDDGAHYLKKVEEAVAMMNADKDVFEDADNFADYEALALVVGTTMETFKDMFKELAAYEGEMNFYDTEVTDLEYKYMESKSIADRFREVAYLNGQTLYDFCMNYEFDEEDFTSLYPLIGALNKGQAAMTKVAHYYDVVRYSMSDYPEAELEAEVAKQEEIYSKTPFNVYTGVDRSIYYGTFALTSEAYRADAYTEGGLIEHMFSENTAWTVSGIAAGATSLILGAWAVQRTLAAANVNATIETAKTVAKEMAYMRDKIYDMTSEVLNATPTSTLGIGSGYGQTCGDAINTLYFKAFPDMVDSPVLAYTTDHAKLWQLAGGRPTSNLSPSDYQAISSINDQYDSIVRGMDDAITKNESVANDIAANAGQSKAALFGTGFLYIVSGVMMIYSAYSLGMTVYNYYHPDYDDVPIALVDLIKTVDGDRYIKYDVVYNAEVNEEGVYEAADLNAFAGQRWNALYYTKSYEAGKPLLADSFLLNTSSSQVKDGYAPVHRFGEVSCYNLNKYNFSGNKTLYLSVKQSKNNKAAVADVPEVVGSMFGTGFLFLAGGIGAALGVGGTIVTQGLLKKKKSKTDSASDTSDED